VKVPELPQLPATLRVKVEPIVRVVPDPIDKLPPIERVAAVVTPNVPELESVKLLLIVVMLVMTSVPVPERVKLE
jgi:hypothetical protein